MRLTHYFFLLVFLVISATSVAAKSKPTWRAVHLLDYNTDAELDALATNLETLAKQVINVIIL